MEYNSIKVGGKFPKSLALGIPAIWYDKGRIDLIMKNSKWTNKELYSINKEPFSIALCEKDNVYGLLVEYTTYSFDIYFNINDYASCDDIIDTYKPFADGTGMLVTIYTVSDSDIVKDIRSVSLQTETSNELIKAIHRQYNKKETLFKKESYTKRTNMLMQKYDFKAMKGFIISKSSFYKKR